MNALILLIIVLNALILALNPALGSAETTVVGFDGLATATYTCSSSSGLSILGEDVSNQFQSLGVLFSVNEFAIAYALGDGLPGSETSLAVNTIDNAINRCPVGRLGNNGVLTVSFVDPHSGAPTTVANVGVVISDAEFSVGIRALSSAGAIVHQCANAFSGCPFVIGSAPYTVSVLFPGSGIARLELTDSNESGYADGFVIDNLRFDPDPAVLLAQCETDFAATQATLTLLGSEHAALIDGLERGLVSIEQTLRRTFDDPQFFIQGATVLSRYQALVNAVLHLNVGRLQGLYDGLRRAVGP